MMREYLEHECDDIRGRRLKWCGGKNAAKIDREKMNNRPMVNMIPTLKAGSPLPRMEKLKANPVQ